VETLWKRPPYLKIMGPMFFYFRFSEYAQVQDTFSLLQCLPSKINYATNNIRDKGLQKLCRKNNYPL
jgi:hypothetical protein